MMMEAVRVEKCSIAPSYAREWQHYSNLIMHVGVGGFHRSHQAYYLHRLLTHDQQTDWAICGVGLMAADAAMARALRSQDHLYTLLSQREGCASVEVIGSIMDYVLVPDDPCAAVARLADEAVKIVSLTVTEKGYCLGVDMHLDVLHPLVAAELPRGAVPRSAVGLLAASLIARRRANVAPFAVMSCDNLPGNGTLLKRAVLEFVQVKAEAGDEEAEAVAASIVAGEVPFPSTLVDRITPMTEPEHRELLEKEHRIIDEIPVVCEEFKQWVIEDNFPSGRPAWEQVGALMVKAGGVDVYESMKLRMLNGSHSAMAYISYLAGHRIVAEAMADPLIHRFVSRYLDEVLPAVPRVDGIDLAAYRASLLERFSNPHLRDTLLRLAEDGSQKLKTTIRPVLLENIAAGSEVNAMAVAIGAWICFMKGVDEQGMPIVGIKDPHGGDSLANRAKGVVAAPTPEVTAQFLSEYLGADVAENQAVVKLIAQAVASLCSDGSRKVLGRF